MKEKTNANYDQIFSEIINAYFKEKPVFIKLIPDIPKFNFCVNNTLSNFKFFLCREYWLYYVISEGNFFMDEYYSQTLNKIPKENFEVEVINFITKILLEKLLNLKSIMSALNNIEVKSLLNFLCVSVGQFFFESLWNLIAHIIDNGYYYSNTLLEKIINCSFEIIQNTAFFEKKWLTLCKIKVFNKKYFDLLTYDKNSFILKSILNCLSLIVKNKSDQIFLLEDKPEILFENNSILCAKMMENKERINELEAERQIRVFFKILKKCFGFTNLQSLKKIGKQSEIVNKFCELIQSIYGKKDLIEITSSKLINNNFKNVNEKIFENINEIFDVNNQLNFKKKFQNFCSKNGKNNAALISNFSIWIDKFFRFEKDFFDKNLGIEPVRISISSLLLALKNLMDLQTKCEEKFGKTKLIWMKIYLADDILRRLINNYLYLRIYNKLNLTILSDFFEYLLKIDENQLIENFSFEDKNKERSLNLLKINIIKYFASYLKNFSFWELILRNILIKISLTVIEYESCLAGLVEILPKLMNLEDFVMKIDSNMEFNGYFLLVNENLRELLNLIKTQCISDKTSGAVNLRRMVSIINVIIAASFEKLCSNGFNLMGISENFTFWKLPHYIYEFMPTCAGIKDNYKRYGSFYR